MVERYGQSYLLRFNVFMVCRPRIVHFEGNSVILTRFSYAIHILYSTRLDNTQAMRYFRCPLSKGYFFLFFFRNRQSFHMTQRCSRFDFHTLCNFREQLIRHTYCRVYGSYKIVTFRVIILMNSRHHGPNEILCSSVFAKIIHFIRSKIGEVVTITIIGRYSSVQ